MRQVKSGLRRTPKMGRNAGPFASKFSNQPSNPFWSAPGAAGASAGAVEALVNCPFETVKVQMQAKENLNRFKVGCETIPSSFVIM